MYASLSASETSVSIFMFSAKKEEAAFTAASLADEASPLGFTASSRAAAWAALSTAVVAAEIWPNSMAAMAKIRRNGTPSANSMIAAPDSDSGFLKMPFTSSSSLVAHFSILETNTLVVWYYAIREKGG